MIKIDLQTVIGLYFLVVFLFFTLVHFIFRQKSSTKEWNVTDHVQRCSYCGHIFVEQLTRTLIQCPLCQSYLEEQNVIKEIKQ